MKISQPIVLLCLPLLIALPACAQLGPAAARGDALAPASQPTLAPVAAEPTASSAPQPALSPEPDPVSQAAYQQPEEAGSQPTTAPLPEPRGAQLILPEGVAPAPDAEAAAFSLEELEQIALANNPTLDQAAAVVGKARGIRRQVGLYPNPTIGYFGEEIGDNGTAGKQGGFISQTIVTGGKLGLSQAVADREIQNLTWELEAQRLRVRNAVRAQFYEVLGAQQRVEIAERLRGIAEQGVNASEQLLEAQQVARPDLLQARIQFNEIRVLLQNARYDYEAAWKQLTSVIGQPGLAPAPLAGNLNAAAPPRDLEQAFAELLAASPELEAARARVARARAQIDRQQVQPIPNLLAQVGVAHDNESGDEIATVQLGVPLPIFNRNQGNVQLAVAELRRAQSDVRRLELALRARLAAAFRDYLKAQNEVERYREDILPTAQENLDLTEEGYRQGEFDIIRVLTARRSFFETNLAYISSQVSLRQADVSISGLLLTGGLDDVPDAGGGNLQGVGLRDEALGGQ